jgi:hypothetical protein
MLPTEDEVGVIDAVDWESIKKQGDQAIKRWIQEQLDGTSVTVVLIGAETADRDWVQYEITESWNRGNGLVGVWINNVKIPGQKSDVKGANPFDKFQLPNGVSLSSVCKTYDWVLQDGRNNLGTWAEEAKKVRAGYSSTDKITTADSGLKKVAVAAGVAMLGAAVLGALSKATQEPISGVRQQQPFTPRAPWCPPNVDER